MFDRLSRGAVSASPRHSTAWPTERSRNFQQAPYRKAVGVLAKPVLLARQLLSLRSKASLGNVTVSSQGGGMRPLHQSHYWVPGNRVIFGRAFDKWMRTGREGGEKPPSEMLRRYQLFKRIEGTLNESEQIRLFAGLLKRQELYAIGIVGDRGVKRDAAAPRVSVRVKARVERVGAEVISEHRRRPSHTFVARLASMTRPVDPKILEVFGLGVWIWLP